MIGRSDIWTMDHFPLVYEKGKVKAVLVDVASFSQIELIMDNLLNRENEPEDAVLVASGLLDRLVDEARQEPTTSDWERELDEL